MADLFEASDNLNGIDATKQAFKQPTAGDSPLRWYLWKRPESYWPFMALVISADEAKRALTCQLLHRETGKALGKQFTVNLNDRSRVFDEVPSTAQLAKPGGSENCGFLLLSTVFTEELIAAKVVSSDDVAQSIARTKWPRGAEASIVNRILDRSVTGPITLTELDRNALRDILGKP